VTSMAHPAALLFLLSTLVAMKSLAYALPSVLLQQYASAAPATVYGPVDGCNPLLDPGCNKLGAVASESSICTNIGIDALKAGGNAADSLVATVFCIGVIGMYHR
jgi:gamma-glutamyltranspeptidase / glutathione hydrolase